MFLLAYDSEDDAQAAANQLMGLGQVARRLLEECVEKQGVKRKKASAAAVRLNDAGFVFIRETGEQWEPEITITPSLAGEEALEWLEHVESK